MFFLRGEVHVMVYLSLSFMSGSVQKAGQEPERG
jgi:hypothetical protein